MVSSVVTYLTYVCHPFKTRVQAARFYLLHLPLRYYECSMHVEGLLPTNLCFFTLLSLEQRLHFERIYMHHV